MLDFLRLILCLVFSARRQTRGLQEAGVDGITGGAGAMASTRHQMIESLSIKKISLFTSTRAGRECQ